jgi:membrane-bound metal-dependent hydrolase YbcI (DUF457 family)
MPSWKKHLTFNAFLQLIWIKFLFDYGFVDNYTLLIFLIFFSSFLSLFPDVDTSKSNIRNVLSLILASTIMVYFFLNSDPNSIFLTITGFVFLYVLFKFFPMKHRGITHNFWFSMFFSFVVTAMLWMIVNFSSINFLVYFFFVLSGYVSHLFLDAIT